MRKTMLALSLAVAFGGETMGATDLIPVGLTVTLADSVSFPDRDSVRVEYRFQVAGDPIVLQKAWTVTQIAVDGVIRLNGNVDSGFTLATGTTYLNQSGFWINKTPISMTAVMDPAGVSGEVSNAFANNLTVRTFNYHPAVIQDTVYTGPGCKVVP